MVLRLKDETEIDIDRYVKEIGNYNGRQCRLDINPTYDAMSFDEIAESLTDDNVSDFTIIDGNDSLKFEGYSFESIRDTRDENAGNIISIRLVKSVSTKLVEVDMPDESEDETSEE